MMFIERKVATVTYGTTLSGDDIPLILWYYHPTHTQINEEYSRLLPEEYKISGSVDWKACVKPQTFVEMKPED